MAAHRSPPARNPPWQIDLEEMILTFLWSWGQELGTGPGLVVGDRPRIGGGTLGIGTGDRTLGGQAPDLGPGFGTGTLGIG